LEWAQRFAYLNRAEMMDRFVHVFAAWMGVQGQRVELERINTTTTTPLVRRWTVRLSGSPARARSMPPKASWASFPDPWEPAHTSCAAREILRGCGRPPTVRAADTAGQG
jgi:hypothetical protein